MESSYQFRPNMSLYIPSVTCKTTEEQVRRVFKMLNIGMVARVDFIDKENNLESGSGQRMAFVHFDFWYINNTSYHLQERIVNKGQGRIVYNDPYYWIVMENSNPRSQAEIRMEKQILELQSRVRYLETVIAVHAKKFMDNNITTKTYPCPDCYADIPNEETECDACEYGKEKEKVDGDIQLDNTLTLNSSGSIIYSGEEYDNAAALAMTGALGMEMEEEDEDESNSSSQPTGNTKNTSNWWLW